MRAGKDRCIVGAQSQAHDHAVVSLYIEEHLLRFSIPNLDRSVRSTSEKSLTFRIIVSVGLDPQVILWERATGGT